MIIRRFAFVFTIVAFHFLAVNCQGERDRLVGELLDTGVEFVKRFSGEFAAAKDAQAATLVIEQNMTRLKTVLARKAELEKRFPELKHIDTRREIRRTHVKRFKEFQKYHWDIQRLYKKRMKLYEHHKPYVDAARRGSALMATFR